MGQRGACAENGSFDVHGHFSLTCCPRFSYGSPSVTWPCRSGNSEVDGSDPPLFCLPDRHSRGRLMCTGVPCDWLPWSSGSLENCAAPALRTEIDP